MESVKIYCYAKADQMEGHGFSDDVAICMAKDKKTAMRNFKKYYAEVNNSDVFLVKLDDDNNFAILTDY